MKNNLRTTPILIILFFVFSLPVLSQTQLSSTIVKVKDGLVEGTLENGITIYRGIPFAAPPVGDLRWRPPQAPKKWDGVLKADKFKPACPQANIPILGYLDYGMSEDCLYLNTLEPEAK
jgi:para-nitrobenzyl esterase